MSRSASYQSSNNKVDHWRNSADYRREYFKKNPGILGFVWWCSQCYVPLLGRSSVEVDHIFPPSKLATIKRDKHGRIVSNTSILARAANTEANLVACCSKCNAKKSDKVGKETVSGGISKVLELIVFTAQKAISVVVGLVLKLVYHLLMFILRLLAKPLISKSPWYVKIAFVAFYAGLIYYAFNTLTEGGSW